MAIQDDRDYKDLRSVARVLVSRRKAEGYQEVGACCDLAAQLLDLDASDEAMVQEVACDLVDCQDTLRGYAEGCDQDAPPTPGS